MECFLKSKFLYFDERRLRQLRAVDMYDELITFLGYFNKYCGTFLMMPDYRWSYRTSMTLFFIVSFMVNLVYTVGIHWGEWYVILDILSVSGIGFQGVKFFSAMVRVDFFQKVHRDLRAMYAKYSVHPEHNYALLRCALLTLHLCQVMAVMYICAGAFLFVMPAYVFITKGERLMPLPLRFMFTDPSTQTGFVFNMLYILIGISFAVPGMVAADAAILHIVLQIVGISNIFKNNLKELDQMLDDPERTQEEIHEKVIEICLMHKEIIQYEENLDDAYYLPVFVQVITSVSGLSLTLFLVYMLNDWTKAMFFFASVFQLLEFCVLGTSLTVKNQEIMTAIYDTKWYLLSQSDQKLIMMILHRSQNAVEMTIGGLYLLNMETFVEVAKTVYSYFAMLITFLN